MQYIVDLFQSFFGKWHEEPAFLPFIGCKLVSSSGSDAKQIAWVGLFGELSLLEIYFDGDIWLLA